MSVLILNENAAPPAAPAGGKVKVYVDNTATPQLKMVDDAGTVTTQVDNANVVTMTNKVLQLGPGAAIAQQSNRSTAVTINAICGVITGNGASLAAGAEATFTVNNNTVGLMDVPVLAVRSGPTASTSVFSVSAVAAGSFNIRARNLSANTADTGAPIINFVVIKAVNS